MQSKLTDVAKLANVSRTTAFRALNGEDRIKESTRLKVLTAAQQLNYRPNKIASALRSKQSKVIGVIFSNLFSGHFYSQIFKGIEDYAFENGYTTILGSSDGNPEKEKMLIRSLIAQQVDGVIAAPILSSGEIYTMLREQHIPVVFVDKYIDGFSADRVVVDNYRGGKMVAEYLIANGHTEIAVCLGPEREATSITSRLRGVEAALRENGLKLNANVRGGQAINSSKEYAYHAAKEYLKDRKNICTAFFGFTDSVALSAMRAFIEAGYKVPQDISIVGYNDDDFAKYLPVALTTVKQPKYEIGNNAMELLLKRMQNQNDDSDMKEIVLQAELVIRESCITR